jgi:hypothetical protein
MIKIKLLDDKFKYRTKNQRKRKTHKAAQKINIKTKDSPAQGININKNE